MAEKVTNELMYEVLKSLQKGQVEIKQEISDLKFRIGSLERSAAGMNDTLVHHTGLFDRLDARLNKIEKRLDLVDA